MLTVQWADVKDATKNNILSTALLSFKNKMTQSRVNIKLTNQYVTKN